MANFSTPGNKPIGGPGPGRMGDLPTRAKAADRTEISLITNARHLLLWAQVVFWTCVGLCFVVTGGGLGHNHGFSVYGGRWTTVLPWAVGIAGAAGLIWRAADALADEDRALARCLRINVVLLVFILVTPDTIDQAFYVAHIVASVALFLFQAISASGSSSGSGRTSCCSSMSSRSQRGSSPARRRRSGSAS